MKKIVKISCIIISVFAFCLSAFSLTELESERQDASTYFTSPYKQIGGVGDPFVMYDSASGRYYMYCTGDYFKCFSSETFKNWESHGSAYSVTEKTFGVKNFWAPEVYFVDGEYIMVYSAANEAGRHSIGIAKSGSPSGPFTDICDHPLFAPDYSVIDASLLFDGDKVYLYYSKDCSENIVNGKKTSQVFGVELKSDLSGIIGEPKLLATPDTAWELLSGSTLWNEGPCVFKENGIYYLLYSANYYATANYAVGYATSSSPLGEYKKADNNPILQGDGETTAGTGHCSVVRTPDGELYIAYHSQTNATTPNGNRMPCIDKLIVGADGKLYVNGPSLAMQPLPSGANGLYQKYYGFSVSSTYESVLGDVKNAFDQKISFKGVSASDLYRFKVNENGYIQIKYDTPIDLQSVWIYGIKYTALSPKSVYAVVNDTYKTKVKTFSTITAMTPTVITFDNLPDAVKVSDVKLYFTTVDDMAAISEIITVEKRDASKFKASRTYGGEFSDVAENAWYYLYVKTAYEYKLANGTSVSAFSPNGKFTVAQALTAAVNIHTVYYGKSVRSAVSGEKWYQPYIDYSIENGIIKAGLFDNDERNITRGEMAIVFANILPESEYDAVRSGQNPDVTSDMACFDAVGKLYRAGIVGGDSGSGNYRPNDEIVRSEACVIFARVALSNFRAK